MADAPGDDVAVLLLRQLPTEIGEAILSRLGSVEAARLRARLAVAEPPTAAADLEAALAHFFDLMRITERAAATTTTTQTAESAPRTPIDEIRALPPDALARALQGEQPGTIAMVLSCLDPVPAGLVIQQMPLELRGDIAVRITRLGARNPELLNQLVAAVAEKGRRLRELPREPSQEEIITNLADMLRAVPRAERFPVLKKIEESDFQLASKISEKLYRIEDLLRIPDRQMQTLLGKLDVKTLALALKGAAPELTEKITRNISSRSREVLSDESELLGNVQASRVRDAQAMVILAVRKAEEDGEITPEE